MKSRWRPALIEAADITVYGVYRLRDPGMPDETVNREYRPELYMNEEDARAAADWLNRMNV